MKDLETLAMYGVVAGIAVCLLAVGLLFAVARFHECRAHGFSTLYCVGQ